MAVPPTPRAKTQLLGMTFSCRVDGVFRLHGEKPFRAKQVFRWMHQSGVGDFFRDDGFGQVLCEKLPEVATIVAPKLMTEQASKDGTRKWLLDVGTGNGIELVFIPEADRGTLCVLSQVGCALDCTFVPPARVSIAISPVPRLSGSCGANRAMGRDPKGERIVSNVVMMGMGEPLANFDSVTAAMDIMLDDHGYGLSRRR